MTSTKINENAIANLSTKQKIKLKNLDIIALVGVSDTGKSETLKMVIDEIEDKEIETSDWNSINKELKKGNNGITCKIIGDCEDRVAIFNYNNRKIGVVTTGDYTDIVSAGLQYLIKKDVNIAIIASHPQTFNLFISEVNVLASQIRTHYVADDTLQKKMKLKNSQILLRYLKC